MRGEGGGNVVICYGRKLPIFQYFYNMKIRPRILYHLRKFDLSEVQVSGNRVEGQFYILGTQSLIVGGRDKVSVWPFDISSFIFCKEVRKLTITFCISKY